MKYRVQFDTGDEWPGNIDPPGRMSMDEDEAERYDAAVTSKRRSKKREWAPGEYRPNCRKRLRLPDEFVLREPDVGPRKKLSEL